MDGSVSGTAVLDKAVAILDALAAGPASIAELSRATGVARPTVHRLCAALEHHGLVGRTADDRRRLGTRLRRLAESIDDHDVDLVALAAEPLRRLRDETGESVQIYVREGSVRRCVAGLESTHGLRTIVEVGARLPLELGSAGAVLSGDRRSLERGWAQSVEEREKGVASVSAPVRRGGEVIAAVSVSGPLDRTTRSPGRKYAGAVTEAATAIEAALAAAAGGVFS